MSDIQRIESGPRMSQAVIHNGTIWLAGQVGTPGGSSKSRILQVTIWLADMASFAEMNAVYDAWIDPENPPTRAAGEAKLATPEHKVEIIVVAALSN